MSDQDRNELDDWAQYVAGFPAAQFENPKQMPPCGHCDGTATRQPYVDEPLDCPWCHKPMCWTCAKVGSSLGECSNVLFGSQHDVY